jgi:hypothetical protein
MYVKDSRSNRVNIAMLNSLGKMSWKMKIMDHCMCQFNSLPYLRFSFSVLLRFNMHDNSIKYYLSKTKSKNRILDNLTKNLATMITFFITLGSISKLSIPKLINANPDSGNGQDLGQNSNFNLFKVPPHWHCYSLSTRLFSWQDWFSSTRLFIVEPENYVM